MKMMIKTILLMVFLFIGGLSAFAQKKSNKRITLTISLQQTSQTMAVSSVTFDFNRLDKDTSDNYDRACALIINMKGHLNPMLLKAAAKDNSQRVFIIKYFGKSGTMTHQIIAADASVVDVSDTFDTEGSGGDNEESAVTIYANHVSMNGVKL